MPPLLIGAGTWSRHALWHQPGSPLWRALDTRGYQPIQFKWSGYCGGIPSPVIVPPDTNDLKGSLELWRSEGEKLLYFCKWLGLEAPKIISHSHMIQNIWFAAEAGQAFETVLDLSGPVREDMAWVRSRTRKHIGRLAHVYDPVGDLTIREGEAFDGHVGWTLALPEADFNIEAHGVGHSGLLNQFDDKEWEDLGLWRVLAGDS